MQEFWRKEISTQNCCSDDYSLAEVGRVAGELDWQAEQHEVGRVTK
jgi:hypothetical protein